MQQLRSDVPVKSPLYAVDIDQEGKQNKTNGSRSPEQNNEWLPCNFGEYKQLKLLGDKLSIPCIVRQPHKSPYKGVIVGDRGCSFDVLVDNHVITLPKAYIHPDFPEKCRTDDDISPSKKRCDPGDSQSPKERAPRRRKRRQKGTGSGSIYYRAVTRNNKEYHQAYYHYKLNGKKGTKYIPQRLLGLIKEAEITKLPVVEVLQLLGEKSISPSKKFDTFKNEEDRAVALTEINPSNELSPSKKDLASLETPEELLGEKSINPSNSFITYTREQITVSNEVIDSHVINPSNELSPSKRQRSRGKGSGSVHYRTIKKKHKEYKQAYYHYEFWRDGDRLIKSSEYIPRKMEAKIMRMNNEKAPVEEILKVLRDRGKRK